MKLQLEEETAKKGGKSNKNKDKKMAENFETFKILNIYVGSLNREY